MLVLPLRPWHDGFDHVRRKTPASLPKHRRRRRHPLPPAPQSGERVSMTVARNQGRIIPWMKMAGHQVGLDFLQK